LENAGCVQRITELEKDIKKLSGQQNLQQRIHHHAKIKVCKATSQCHTNQVWAGTQVFCLNHADVGVLEVKYWPT